MWWILTVALQAIVIVSGIRQEQRAGLWSWSKFIFALAFAGLECVILMVPDTYIDLHSSYFAPVMIAASVVAALNFIWFIVVMRRWRLPDGRTSLQAYRDGQRGL
jgi:hypothetical protein